MTKQILIIDSDKGFSTILSEALNNHPAFQAVATSSSAQAIQYAVENTVDLAIIDLGLSDMPPLKLAHALREAKEDLALMVIPLMGQDVPSEVTDLGIQGILPKPFFVGDLPKLVGQTVGLELESEEPAPPAAPQTTRVLPAAPRRPRPRFAPRTPNAPNRRTNLKPRELRPVRHQPRPSARNAPAAAPSILPSWKLEQLHKHQGEIVDLLRTLNTEIRAEVIFLTAGSELVAKAGSMPDERAQTLAALVAASAEAAAQAAAFLGERDAKFEQSLHEGHDFRLYSYSLGQGVVLSLALGTNIPLGILRHQTRLTGKDLMKYIK